MDYRPASPQIVFAFDFGTRQRTQPIRPEVLERLSVQVERHDPVASAAPNGACGFARGGPASSR